MDGVRGLNAQHAEDAMRALGLHEELSAARAKAWNPGVPVLCFRQLIVVITIVIIIIAIMIIIMIIKKHGHAGLSSELWHRQHACTAKSSRFQMSLRDLWPLRLGAGRLLRGEFCCSPPSFFHRTGLCMSCINSRNSGIPRHRAEKSLA